MANSTMKYVTWIIIAVVIAAAIVGAVYVYTQTQSRPFWEVPQ